MSSNVSCASPGHRFPRKMDDAGGDGALDVDIGQGGPLQGFRLVLTDARARAASGR